jgi:hypothetical protein
LCGVHEFSFTTFPHASIKASEISSSHGGEYEDGCLLGCCAMAMEAGSTSETSVNFYLTTQRNNPEDSHLLSGHWT